MTTLTDLSPENELRLIEAVDMLPDAFPGKDFPDSSRALYVRVLSRYPIDLVEGAITEAIVAADRGFIPAVGEITNRLAERVADLPEPHEAWGMVLDRLTVPAMHAASTPWDAPQAVKDAVKQIGGISALRGSENQVSDRKQFIDAYTKARSKQVNHVQVHGLKALTQTGPRTLTPVAPGMFTSHPEEWPASLDWERPAALPTGTEG